MGEIERDKTRVDPLTGAEEDNEGRPPSPDGRLALIDNDRTAEVLDWETDEKVRSITAPVTRLTAAIWAPDSRHPIASTGDGRVTRWELDSGKPVARFEARWNFGAGLRTSAVSADGKTLATSDGGDVTFWDADEAFQAVANP